MIVVQNHNIENENCNISHQMLFQTPVFEIEIKDIDNKKLLENVYKLKKIDPDGCQRSNCGGWHSSLFTITKKQDQDSIHLFTPLFEKLQYILPILPFEPTIVSFQKCVIWANINNKNSFNDRHNHPGCDLSGVYYVKILSGNAGSITFYDPRQALSYSDHFIKTRYVGGERIARFPIEGNMYLFPPSLEHSVMPNETEEDRISISFNLSLE